MLEMLKERKAALEAQGKKGFTLMEMLIVIAIIAVLIAIAIPIFTSQLEKAREATDEANIRSMYAECSASALAGSKSSDNPNLTVTTNNGVTTAVGTVALTQQANGLEGGATSINIGGVNVDASGFGPGKTATVTVKSDGTAPTITFA